MKTNTKRLAFSILLIGLVIVNPACTMPAPAPALDVEATQTFSILFTQVAGVTSTPIPSPTDTPTPTATLDPISLTVTSQALTASPTPTLPPGARPTSYTLQPGEFPWCIARRFNVDPAELLSANGLISGMIYKPNLTLTIPQSGKPFPAPRALNPHPATYIVQQANTTVHAVACYFGDVDPLAIMQANGLTSFTLATGTTLSIP